MNGKSRESFSEEGQTPEGDEGTGRFGRWEFPTEETASAKALRQIGLAGLRISKKEACVAGTEQARGGL